MEKTLTEERLSEISRRIFASEPAGSPPPPRWVALELLQEVRRLQRVATEPIPDRTQRCGLCNRPEVPLTAMKAGMCIDCHFNCGVGSDRRIARAKQELEEALKILGPVIERPYTSARGRARAQVQRALAVLNGEHVEAPEGE